MKVECKFVNGVSKKTGNPYTALDLDLGHDCVKRVFLTSSELALFQLNYPEIK